MARRSSIARYPSAASPSGSSRSNTLPGSILWSQMRSISWGRNRRTGAGPPCRCTPEKNNSSPGMAKSWNTPDVADMPAGPGGTNGLHQRLLGADRFDDRVGAEPVGELLDPRHAGVAALCDDVGGAELTGQSLAVGVAPHRDDPPGAELARRENPHQPHGAVARMGAGRYMSRPSPGGRSSRS
jgi:hypothetical protein